MCLGWFGHHPHTPRGLAGRDDKSGQGTRVPRRRRLARVPRKCGRWYPGGKRPCTSGTYATRKAGARGFYVPFRGPGAHVSAQAVTTSTRPEKRPSATPPANASMRKGSTDATTYSRQKRR